LFWFEEYIIFTVVIVTLILPNILFPHSTYLYTTLTEFNLEHLISVVSIDIDWYRSWRQWRTSQAIQLTKEQVTFVVAAHRTLTYLRSVLTVSDKVNSAGTLYCVKVTFAGIVIST